MSLLAFIPSLLSKFDESKGVMAFALAGAGIGAIVAAVLAAPAGVVTVAALGAAAAAGGGRAIGGDVVRSATRAWKASENTRKVRRKKIDEKAFERNALKAAKNVINEAKRLCSEVKKLSKSDGVVFGDNVAPLIKDVSVGHKKLSTELRLYSASPTKPRLDTLINDTENLVVLVRDGNGCVAEL